MKRVLITGRSDDTMNAIEAGLSENYSVRRGSSVSLAVFGLLASFSPDVAAVKLSDADNSIFVHINEKYPELKVIAAGEESDLIRFPDLRADRIVAYEPGAVCDAVIGLVPVSPDEFEERNITVMIIDDDTSMLRMMKVMLEKEYTVILAPSGDKAMKLLERRKPDIILLDYEMPEMNGADTIALIRADSRFADIPVIFLTGVSEPGLLGSIGTLGAAGCIIKPTGMAEVKAAITKNVSR